MWIHHLLLLLLLLLLRRRQLPAGLWVLLCQLL
jgi:hypothetical protein